MKVLGITEETLEKPRFRLGRTGKLIRRHTGDTIFYEELGLGNKSEDKPSAAVISVYDNSHINQEIQ